MHLYKLRSFYLPREPLLDLVINHIAKKSKQKIGYYIIYQYSDFHRRGISALSIVMFELYHYSINDVVCLVELMKDITP